MNLKTSIYNLHYNFDREYVNVKYKYGQHFARIKSSAVLIAFLNEPIVGSIIDSFGVPTAIYSVFCYKNGKVYNIYNNNPELTFYISDGYGSGASNQEAYKDYIRKVLL